MVLNVEEGIECEVYVDRIWLEHVSEFKYLGCVLDESDTNGAGCNKKVARGMCVAGAIRSPVNARVLHETLLVPVLTYGVRQCYGKTRDLELGL